MDRYRDGRYAEDNPDWHEGDGDAKAAAIADFLRATGVWPRRITDVGCGSGAVLAGLVQRLRDQGEDTRGEGWDISPDAIARARCRESRHLRFHVAEATTIRDFSDLVLCIDVIEHLADDLAFLREIRPLGERFLFRIPLELSVWDVLRPQRRLDARRRFGHRHAYDRAAAENLLNEAGFEVEASRFHRVPVRAHGLGRWSDALRRATVALAPRWGVRAFGGFGWLVLARPVVAPAETA